MSAIAWKLKQGKVNAPIEFQGVGRTQNDNESAQLRGERSPDSKLPTQARLCIGSTGWRRWADSAKEEKDAFPRLSGR